MARYIGYLFLTLFLLCGLVAGWIYYGTFAPGGGRIDPRFVVIFKILEWTEGRADGTAQHWRDEMNEMMVMASAGMAPVFGVRTQDRVLTTKDGAVPVRIYDPETAAGDRRPFILFLHGGGFFAGTVNTHDRIARSLASKAGAVVVSVEYRLAPEFPFPAGFDDAYAALVWASGEAKALRADPDRLAVAGDSAGGNLAAAICLRARDLKGPRVAYQFLIYPVLNLADFESETVKLYGGGGFFITQDAMSKMRSYYLPAGGDGKSPYASPLHAENLRDLPPALVITAEFDPLRWEGEAYVARLKAQGVNARAHRYEGLGHGFVSMTRLMPESDQAIDEIAATLKASL